ncbi:MAG: hypothetical protein Q7T18_03455, partial [Sedimentisphaerales bacterium]|nr:hypothetical protein [Sedimentisphaerales bacterium]
MSRKTMLLWGMLLLAAAACNTYAAPNPSDSTLALWLKADAGVTTSIDPNMYVQQWQDQRTGSTNIAAPMTDVFIDPNAAIAYPHPPKLTTVYTAGGRSFPVVRVDARRGIGGYLTIPAVYGDESFILGGNLSLFVVYNPTYNGTDASYHSIVSLRDTQGSLYDMNLQNSFHMYAVDPCTP